MFNRRTFLIGSIITTIHAPLKTRIFDDPPSELDGFVFYEDGEPLSLNVRRNLQWGRAGRLFVLSPDLARVVTLERSDDRAYLWDADTATKLHTLWPIPRKPASIFFNSDGTLISTTGTDGATRTWIAATGLTESTARAACWDSKRPPIQ